MQSCSTDGCENPAARKTSGRYKGRLRHAGLCERCVKFRQRHPGLTPPPARPYGASIGKRLTEAAIAYSEAEDDAAYRRAKKQLLRSARRAATGRWS